MLASLDDPNVVRLYEYVESPVGAAIVMELDRRRLAARDPDHQGETTPEAALVVLQGSLLGLAAAHRRGVVHRDYKPENVLVNGHGASKLTDFGIAARAGDRRSRRARSPTRRPSSSPASRPARPATSTRPPPPSTSASPASRRSAGDRRALLHQHRSEPVPLEPVPSRCGRWWPPGWPRTPQTGRPTRPPLSPPSARSRSAPTARTGRNAAGRT